MNRYVVTTDAHGNINSLSDRHREVTFHIQDVVIVCRRDEDDELHADYVSMIGEIVSITPVIYMIDTYQIRIVVPNRGYYHFDPSQLVRLLSVPKPQKHLRWQEVGF